MKDEGQAGGGLRRWSFVLRHDSPRTDNVPYEWHSRRARCALHAQLAGYDVAITYAAAPAPFGPDDWWRDAAMRADVLHELGGLIGYGLRYGMRPWGCL